MKLQKILTEQHYYKRLKVQKDNKYRFNANLSLKLPVKELRKAISIMRSYWDKFGGFFFMRQ